MNILSISLSAVSNSSRSYGLFLVVLPSFVTEATPAVCGARSPVSPSIPARGGRRSPDDTHASIYTRVLDHLLDPPLCAWLPRQSRTREFEIDGARSVPRTSWSFLYIGRVDRTRFGVVLVRDSESARTLARLVVMLPTVTDSWLPNPVPS